MDALGENYGESRFSPSLEEPNDAVCFNYDLFHPY